VRRGEQKVRGRDELVEFAGVDEGEHERALAEDLTAVVDQGVLQGGDVLQSASAKMLSNRANSPTSNLTIL
jgi:hypothetical protein